MKAKKIAFSEEWELAMKYKLQKLFVFNAMKEKFWRFFMYSFNTCLRSALYIRYYYRYWLISANLDLMFC